VTDVVAAGAMTISVSGQITKVFEADARRRWNDEEKRAIIEESRTAPVARVAKKHGVAVSLLFRWRKAEGIGVRSASPRQRQDEAFIRLSLPGLAEAQLSRSPGSIEIVLGSGRRVIVGTDIDTDVLKRIIAALEEGLVGRPGECQKFCVRAQDVAIYPDIDLLFDSKFDGYTHKDGTPYPK
jgi:transposase-like protein